MRRLVTRMVHPMRVCTGAVIDFPMPKSLRQLDLIIWAPHPAPAIFEVEGFGLVPRSSSFGVIEIKRSNYSDADRHISEVLDLADANAIVRDTPTPGRPANMRASAFGIVCVLEKEPSALLKALIDQKRAAAIFNRSSNGGVEVRTKDVLELVNFLYLTTWQFRFFSTLGHPIQINTSGL